MRRISLAVLTIIGVSIFPSSCKTYYIPVDSFKEQFAGVAKSKEVTVRGPIGDRVTYKTFPVDYVKCVDKKGNPVTLPVSPSLEIRFTDNHNKKSIFYFDKILVTDSTVSGGQSRIINVNKTIPLSNIKKIEVQDGKKNYTYIK